MRAWTLSIGLWGIGCGAPCDPEEQAWALLPPNATDCGDDLACLAVAVESGTPALARSSTQGMDSWLTTAHAWTGDRLWWLNHDSMSPGRVDGYECVEPRVEDGAIACDHVAPEGDHYAVCGSWGGLPFEP